MHRIGRRENQLAGTGLMDAIGGCSDPANREEATSTIRRANRALVDLLARIAERKKATPAQIALAWVLAQKPWMVPIPGTTKVTRLEENVAAASVELSADELGEVQDGLSKLTVQGNRYPDNLERLTGR